MRRFTKPIASTLVQQGLASFSNLPYSNNTTANPSIARAREAVEEKFRHFRISEEKPKHRNPFSFTSDTGSPLDEEVMKSLIISNSFVDKTGDISYINIEREAVESLFQSEDKSKKPTVFFSSSTTQANKLAIVAIADVNPLKGDLCLASTHSHFFAFEVNQPAEAIKPSDTVTGKLTVDDLGQSLKKFTDIGKRVKVVHLDQPTKGDYFYSPEEITKITDWCHENKIAVSMDVERLVGQLARTKTKYVDYTLKCGVDIAMVGMQKNGGARSSVAVVLSDEYLSEPTDLVRRVQSYQRCIGNVTDNPLFVATGWKKMVDQDHYLRNAELANNAADAIAGVISEYKFDGNKIFIQNNPLTTNMIFAKFPRNFVNEFNNSSLSPHIKLSPDRYGTTRIVTSFDTRQEEVDELITKLNQSYQKVTGQAASYAVPRIIKTTSTEPEAKKISVEKAIIRADRRAILEISKENQKLISDAILKKIVNEAPKLPEVIESLSIGNAESYHPPYGDDEISKNAIKHVKELFGNGIHNPRVVFTASKNQAVNVAFQFVASVGGPNASLVSEDSAMYHSQNGRSIKAVELSEKYKETGKLNPDIVGSLLNFHNKSTGKHVPLLTSVTIEQPTRSGHIYSKEEIKKLSDVAHLHNVPLIVNFNRFSYYLARTGETFKDYSTDCGVDICTLGFNGLGGANSSAIVVINSRHLSIDADDIDIKLNRTVKGNGGKQSGSSILNRGWDVILERDRWRTLAED